MYQFCRGSPLGRASDCLSDSGGFDSRPRRQILRRVAAKRILKRPVELPGVLYLVLRGFPTTADCKSVPEGSEVKARGALPSVPTKIRAV